MKKSSKFPSFFVAFSVVLSAAPQAALAQVVMRPVIAPAEVSGSAASASAVVGLPAFAPLGSFDAAAAPISLGFAAPVFAPAWTPAAPALAPAARSLQPVPAALQGSPAAASDRSTVGALQSRAATVRQALGSGDMSMAADGLNALFGEGIPASGQGAALPGDPQNGAPVSVMVEVSVPPGVDLQEHVKALGVRLNKEYGFVLDEGYKPVPMAGGTVIVLGTVPQANLENLSAALKFKVWPNIQMSPLSPAMGVAPAPQVIDALKSFKNENRAKILGVPGITSVGIGVSKSGPGPSLLIYLDGSAELENVKKELLKRVPGIAAQPVRYKRSGPIVAYGESGVAPSRGVAAAPQVMDSLQKFIDENSNKILGVRGVSGAAIGRSENGPGPGIDIFLDGSVPLETVKAALLKAIPELSKRSVRYEVSGSFEPFAASALALKPVTAAEAVSLSGLVVRRLLNQGSKSEHYGFVLQAADGSELMLYRPGANPFEEDAVIKAHEGRQAVVSGFVKGGKFRVLAIAAPRDVAASKERPRPAVSQLSVTLRSTSGIERFIQEVPVVPGVRKVVQVFPNDKREELAKIFVVSIDPASREAVLGQLKGRADVKEAEPVAPRGIASAPAPAPQRAFGALPPSASPEKTSLVADHSDEDLGALISALVARGIAASGYISHKNGIFVTVSRPEDAAKAVAFIQSQPIWGELHRGGKMSVYFKPAGEAPAPPKHWGGALAPEPYKSFSEATPRSINELEQNLSAHGVQVQSIRVLAISKLIVVWIAQGDLASLNKAKELLASDGKWKELYRQGGLTVSENRGNRALKKQP